MVTDENETVSKQGDEAVHQKAGPVWGARAKAG